MLWVESVNGPDYTFIVGASGHGTNGPAAVRCVWIADGLLTGVTITNGHTQTTGDWACQRGGGVFLNHGGTVSNCVIRSNSANITGGEVDFHYGGVARSCLIAGNEDDNGGGGAFYYYGCSGARIESCTLADTRLSTAAGSTHAADRITS